MSRELLNDEKMNLTALPAIDSLSLSPYIDSLQLSSLSPPKKLEAGIIDLADNWDNFCPAEAKMEEGEEQRAAAKSYFLCQAPPKFEALYQASEQMLYERSPDKQGVADAVIRVGTVRALAGEIIQNSAIDGGQCPTSEPHDLPQDRAVQLLKDRDDRFVEENKERLQALFCQFCDGACSFVSDLTSKKENDSVEASAETQKDKFKRVIEEFFDSLQAIQKEDPELGKAGRKVLDTLAPLEEEYKKFKVSEQGNPVQQDLDQQVNKLGKMLQDVSSGFIEACAELEIPLAEQLKQEIKEKGPAAIDSQKIKELCKALGERIAKDDKLSPEQKERICKMYHDLLEQVQKVRSNIECYSELTDEELKLTGEELGKKKHTQLQAAVEQQRRQMADKREAARRALSALEQNAAPSSSFPENEQTIGRAIEQNAGIIANLKVVEELYEQIDSSSSEIEDCRRQADALLGEQESSFARLRQCREDAVKAKKELDADLILLKRYAQTHTEYVQQCFLEASNRYTRKFEDLLNPVFNILGDYLSRSFKTREVFLSDADRSKEHSLYDISWMGAFGNNLNSNRLSSHLEGLIASAFPKLIPLVFAATFRGLVFDTNQMTETEKVALLEKVRKLEQRLGRVVFRPVDGVLSLIDEMELLASAELKPLTDYYKFQGIFGRYLPS